MDSRLLQHDTFVVVLLQENTDPNGKHLEYRDLQGAVFAKVAKVYRKGGFLNLFPKDSHVHGELKDSAGELLLTTTSYRGDGSPRERKVEVNRADGSLLATLFDAPFGADFVAPDGRPLGKARRPEVENQSERVFNYTYSDAAGQAAGTCERHYPNRSTSLSDSFWDLLSGSVRRGMPVDLVTLQPSVDPLLRTMLFLFPTLQYLRFTLNG
jgi:hypothetical protein